MRLEGTTRQKSGQLELPFGSRGETPRAERSGELSTASSGNARSGTTTKLLTEQVVERSNVIVALKRVQKNKGSPGIDGMTVQEFEVGSHARDAQRAGEELANWGFLAR